MFEFWCRIIPAQLPLISVVMLDALCSGSGSSIEILGGRMNEIGASLLSLVCCGMPLFITLIFVRLGKFQYSAK
jgi:hypothetical protein